MSDKTCDLFCFHECGDKYDTLIMKKDIQLVQKLSLKKLAATNSREIAQDKNKIKKSASHSKMQRYRSSTDRSIDQRNHQELQLYKKKMQIEKEIEEVNTSINQLNDKYKHKIAMLKKIKQQLDNLLSKNTP